MTELVLEAVFPVVGDDSTHFIPCKANIHFSLSYTIYLLANDVQLEFI